jgi:hypothetical protein
MPCRSCIIPIKPEHIDAWLNPDPANLAAQDAILDDRNGPYTSTEWRPELDRGQVANGLEVTYGYVSRSTRNSR